MIEALADLAVRAPRRVLLGAALFAVVGAAFGLETPRLLGRGVNEFVAGGSESIRAQTAIQRASGLSAAPEVLVLVHRPTAARLRRVRSVVRGEPAFPVPAKPLLSRDRSEAIVPAYARATVSEHAGRSRRSGWPSGCGPCAASPSAAPRSRSRRSTTRSSTT